MESYRNSLSNSCSVSIFVIPAQAGNQIRKDLTQSRQDAKSKTHLGVLAPLRENCSTSDRNAPVSTRAGLLVLCSAGQDTDPISTFYLADSLTRFLNKTLREIPA